MATGNNVCQNGLLAKAKVILMFWTQALSHSLQGFSKKEDIKTIRCYGAIFAF